MDNSKIVFLINDQVRCLEAVYEKKGTPEWFKTFDQSLAVGDFAVVQSESRHNLVVVEVTAVDCDVNFDSQLPLRWVVQVVNMEGFKEVLAQEAEAISAVQAAELRRKKAELRATMFKDHEASIAALALSHSSDDLAVEPPASPC